MTVEEWNSLRVGSIIANSKGDNPRSIIKIGNVGHIYLPTTRSPYGNNYTIYSAHERRLFSFVKHPEEIINNYQIY